MRQLNIFLVGVALFYFGCFLAYKTNSKVGSLSCLMFGLGLMVAAPNL